MGLYSICKNRLRGYRDAVNTVYPSRDFDIYLVTFPKSGTTFCSMLLGSYFLKLYKPEMNLNWFNLHMFVPDVHGCPKGEIHPPDNYNIRVIKSHSKVNWNYRSVFFVWRDPIEQMKSNYRFQRFYSNYNKSFSNFIRGKHHGISKWISFHKNWIYDRRPSSRVIFFRYENILKSPEKFLETCVEFSGLKYISEVGEYAISRSSKVLMSQHEEQYKAFTVETSKEPFAFVDGGKLLDFQIDDKDIEFIQSHTEQICNKLLEKNEYLVKKNTPF